MKFFSPPVNSILPHKLQCLCSVHCPNIPPRGPQKCVTYIVHGGLLLGGGYVVTDQQPHARSSRRCWTPACWTFSSPPSGTSSRCPTRIPSPVCWRDGPMYGMLWPNNVLPDKSIGSHNLFPLVGPWADLSEGRLWIMQKRVNHIFQDFWHKFRYSNKVAGFFIIHTKIDALANVVTVAPSHSAERGGGVLHAHGVRGNGQTSFCSRWWKFIN